MVFIDSDKIQTFKEKLESKEQFVSATVSLTTSQYIKAFLIRLEVVLTVMIYKKMLYELCQHLGNLHNPMEKYFPNDQCIRLQNHARNANICSKCELDQCILMQQIKKNYLIWFQIPHCN